MRRQKLYTSQAFFGPGAVQDLIRHLFSTYSGTKVSEGANWLWYSSVTHNPYRSEHFRAQALAAAKAYEETLLGGRKPASVAAAIVYAVSRSMGFGVKQSGVCGFFGVTEVSVRNNINYLVNQGMVQSYNPVRDYD